MHILMRYLPPKISKKYYSWQHWVTSACCISCIELYLMHYVGTIVGQLTATDNEQDELTFSITSATSFFSINSSTGVIYIATKIDLEVNTPCMHDNMIAWTVFVSPNSQGGLAFATLSIMVRVADAIGGSSVPVSITVVDINDNAPIFQNLPNSVNVNEVRMLAVTCRSYLEDMFFFCVCVCALQNSPGGSFIFRVQAIDRDVLRNADILFSLVVSYTQ